MVAEAPTKDYDFLLKFLIIGDAGVGKSSLLFKYVDDVYRADYRATIGVDFKMKMIHIDGKKYKLQIWDTAGSERLSKIVSPYFRGCHGVIVAYDTTNRDSFNSLEYWYNQISANSNTNPQKILVGTKIDKIKEKTVYDSEARQFANLNNSSFFLTSAKDESGNVEVAFESLVRDIVASGRGFGIIGAKSAINMAQNSVKGIEDNSWKCC
ncbi:MAG: ras GTPase [Marteilia pararefringens]